MTRRPNPSLLGLAVTALAALVALAVFVGPRALSAIGPASATPTAGPTFNVPAALTAQVDSAGSMRTGGLWAAQGSYLMTSVDMGATWHAGHVPSPFEAIYVLDAVHAWTVQTAGNDSAVVSRLHVAGLVVSRTTDGGYLWQEASIPDVACLTADLAFVDANRGFLLCLGAGTASAAGGSTDAVYRTGDGGASWSPAGTTSGLGSYFAASDAQTLWSAPDFTASQTQGVFLSVSRDAGGTWSQVTLPEAAPLKRASSGYSTAAGPVFWDASGGAFAVNVGGAGGGASPATWFYRTTDGGRSWTLLKTATANPAVGGVTRAVVGRIWAVVRPDADHSLAVSSDFGTTWKATADTGMPPSTAWLWLDFSDATHGAGTVFIGPGTDALLLTSDGGRTWEAADFGDARTHVRPDLALDSATAKRIADEYSALVFKDPANAWNRLSSYSQRQFGGEPAFESTEAALAKRVGANVQLGAAARWDGVGPESGVWADVRVFADLSRSYMVVVSFPGTTEPAEKLIVAPTTITGEWRVWIAPAG